MKTFTELTEDQQKLAVERVLTDLLNDVVSGSIRFNDKLNDDDLQAQIDAACENADKMQTPWFAGEYVLDTCRKSLESMARCTAEDALYSEPGEHVLAGIAK